MKKRLKTSSCVTTNLINEIKIESDLERKNSSPVQELLEIDNDLISPHIPYIEMISSNRNIYKSKMNTEIDLKGNLDAWEEEIDKDKIMKSNKADIRVIYYN